MSLVHGVMGYFYSESVGNVHGTLAHVGQSRASYMSKYVDFFAVTHTFILC